MKKISNRKNGSDKNEDRNRTKLFVAKRAVRMVLPTKWFGVQPNLTLFATLKTPAGFPMPELPKRTAGRKRTPDCQEHDVDICVQNIILEKDWITKVYDKDAIKDWSTKSWSYYKKMNDGVLRYAVDECRWRQKQWKCRIGTPATISKAGLVLSKDNICEDLCSSIMEYVQNFRQQEAENSMSTVALHPKYKKIHQLVHPSIYAYEKGVTHILPGVGAATVSSPPWDSFLGINGTANNDKPVKPDTEGSRTNGLYGNTYHRHEVDPPTAAECSNFRWLPSEFFVSSPSDSDAKITTKPKCRINSYINNLHPIKYQGLYDKIGELFVETLPLMEEVLSEVNNNGKVRMQLPRFDSKVRKRNSWRPCMRTLQPEEKQIVEPPIPHFSTPKYATKAKYVNLKDHPLQVIVKLISMELKPDREEYSPPMTDEQLLTFCNRESPHCFYEGHWHVEGTHDERIVASACCYLGSENISEEGLHFRDGSVGSLGCELGTVETCPGRILVWPNYLHHKTGTITLIDQEQPGHRTLCCFYLVDPTLRIRSTATVPPQQQTWLNELAKVALPSLLPDGLVPVITQKYMVKDGSTINYEEALERRQRLSKERSGDCKVIAANLWIPED